MIPREELPFLPKFKWKLWLPIIAVIAAFPVFWLHKSHTETVALRDSLLQQYSSLTATLAPQYRQRRDALERHILETSQPYPGDFAADGFTLSELTREPALYARVRIPELRDRAHVMASVRHRYPDQFAACLGLETVAARDVMDRGAFLLPSFVTTVREAQSVERVKALRSDLLFRLSRDTSLLVDGTRRRYLVIVTDEARASTDGPTRASVWDLTTDRLVLRARSTGGDVMIVPFRIHGIASARPSHNPIGPTSVSAHDCSIADAVRRLLGASAPNVPHAPDPSAFVTSDAGHPDASPTASPDASSADATSINPQSTPQP